MIRRTFPVAALAVASGLALAACGGAGGTPASRPTRTVTITAAPSQSATTAPATVTSPAAQPAAAAACLTRYLNGTVGLSQGTSGAVEIAIVFKNLNNTPCTLYGFPGVSLAAGTPVTDVGQPSSENTTTARELVTLAPGGFANATLQIEDAANFPAASCAPMSTTWIEVIPPNQTVPLNIPYNTTGCAGSTAQLSVTAVRPGNGG